MNQSTRRDAQADGVAFGTDQRGEWVLKSPKTAVGISGSRVDERTWCSAWPLFGREWYTLTRRICSLSWWRSNTIEDAEARGWLRLLTTVAERARSVRTYADTLQISKEECGGKKDSQRGL